MYGKIYLIVDKTNNKKYVGQTTGAVEKRFKSHSTEKRNRHISNVIQSRGVNNFEVSELCSCKTLEDLNYMEVYFVKYFNCMYPNGYNHRAGGDQKGICSDETRNRISQSKTGKPNFKKRGEPRSLEYRIKISKGLNGKQILATNLDTGETKIYQTAHSTREDGHNPSNVVQICKKNTYRTHSKRWKFEYIENANQSGSTEEISGHAQRLGSES